MAASTFLLAALAAGWASAQELVVGVGERFETIQAAIEAAAPGDTVRVKPGSYAEVIDFKGKLITVASASGPAQTTIDGTGIKAPVVTFKTAETLLSILDGFTLTHGSGAPLTPATVMGGGGVFIDKSTPTVRNCIITANTANKGGGIFVQGPGGGGSIENCQVMENKGTATAGPVGGGMMVQFTGTTTDVLTVTGCNFNKNTVAALGAVQGGGAYFGTVNTKAKVVIKDCTFNDNTLGTAASSTGEGAGLFLDTIIIEMEGGEVTGNSAFHGAGIAMRNQGLTSFLRGVKINSNKTVATGGGGGIFFAQATNSRLTLTKCEFSENTCGSDDGGAMHVQAGSPNFEQCLFISNSSGDQGGVARVVFTGKAKFNACRFISNSATTQGGAIYISSSASASIIFSNCVFSKNTSGTEGGAVQNRSPASAPAKFFYCTFFGNTAGAGIGSIHHDVAGSAAVIQNSIFAGNKTGASPTDYSTTPVDVAKISWSDVESVNINRPGMKNVDPGFVDRAADPPDLRLKNDSPLIDAGDVGTDADGKLVSSDIKGDPRVADGNSDSSEVPDMGAYELVLGPVLRPKFVRGRCRHPQIPVGEGVIDISDPLYLLRWQFGGLYPEPGCIKACDADDSGKIEVTDAVYLLNYMFGGGPDPKLPFPQMGEDPSFDSLTCAQGKLD